MKYCPHCGQKIQSDALVCPYCGYQQSRVSRDRPESERPDQSESYGPESSYEPNYSDYPGSDYANPDDQPGFMDSRYNYYGDQSDDQPDLQQPNPGPSAFSKAKLTFLDIAMLAVNVINALYLLYLGVQGIALPHVINTTGMFWILVLSFVSIVLLCFEIHQNRYNRLPYLAEIVGLIGNASVFALNLLLVPSYLLVSAVIIVLFLYLFYREVKKTY